MTNAAGAEDGDGAEGTNRWHARVLLDATEHGIFLDRRQLTLGPLKERVLDGHGGLEAGLLEDRLGRTSVLLLLCVNCVNDRIVRARGKSLCPRTSASSESHRHRLLAGGGDRGKGHAVVAIHSGGLERLVANARATNAKSRRVAGDGVD
jgi:hypothetical protein